MGDKEQYTKKSDSELLQKLKAYFKDPQNWSPESGFVNWDNQNIEEALKALGIDPKTCLTKKGSTIYQLFRDKTIKTG